MISSSTYCIDFITLLVDCREGRSTTIHEVDCNTVVFNPCYSLVIDMVDFYSMELVVWFYTTLSIRVMKNIISPLFRLEDKPLLLVVLRGREFKSWWSRAAWVCEYLNFCNWTPVAEKNLYLCSINFLVISMNVRLFITLYTTLVRSD